MKTAGKVISKAGNPPRPPATSGGRIASSRCKNGRANKMQSENTHTCPANDSPKAEGRQTPEQGSLAAFCSEKPCRNRRNRKTAQSRQQNTVGWQYGNKKWPTIKSTIERIRAKVRAGIPIACHAVGAGESEHWFVPYKLDGSTGSTWATCGIWVLDPYNSDENSYNGRKVPIWTAMSDSKVTLGINRARIPK